MSVGVAIQEGKQCYADDVSIVGQQLYRDFHKVKADLLPLGSDEMQARDASQAFRVELSEHYHLVYLGADPMTPLGQDISPAVRTYREAVNAARGEPIISKFLRHRRKDRCDGCIVADAWVAYKRRP